MSTVIQSACPWCRRPVLESQAALRTRMRWIHAGTCAEQWGARVRELYAALDAEREAAAGGGEQLKLEV